MNESSKGYIRNAMLWLRPKFLLTVLCLFVIVLLGVDVAARVVAQNEVAARAKAATGATSASAGISGFPFLGYLLAEGTIQGLDVQLSNATVGTLQLEHVEVQLTDTIVDRAALFSAHKVRLKSIASATATVTVTAAELTSAIGESVTLPGSGQILLSVAGRQVPAAIHVLSGHLLVLTAAGVPVLTSDLALNPLVPTCDFVLSLGVGQLSVSCHVAPVPVGVVNAIAGG